MIPDKIYLWETPIVNGGYDPAWHKNSFNDSDVEYIRKDALLEWASGELMPGNSAEGKGWNLALQTLIDKLNSM